MQFFFGDAQPFGRLPARFAFCGPNQHKAALLSRRRALLHIDNRRRRPHTVFDHVQRNDAAHLARSLVAGPGVASMTCACVIASSAASIGKVISNGSRERTAIGISESIGR